MRCSESFKKSIWTGAAAMTLAVTSCAFGAEPTLREASWFWGHEPGLVDGPGNSFKVPVGKERALSMTDAARAFGVPGLSVIRYAAPGTNAAAVAEFASVSRLAWMASSCYSDERLNRAMANGAIEGAARMPNLVGLDLDDYFLQFGEALTNDVSTGRPVKVRRGVFSLAELEDVVRRAHAAPRPLDIRAVVYCDLEPAQVVPEAKPVLDRVDTVMFWTWNASNLVQLAKNYETCRKLVPGKRFLLGLYLWDFGGKREVTDAEMRIQLDFALEKFRAGELDGVVFHCTPLVNKGLRAVKLAKEWLDRNGDVRFGCGRFPTSSRSSCLKSNQGKGAKP